MKLTASLKAPLLKHWVVSRDVVAFLLGLSPFRFCKSNAGVFGVSTPPPLNLEKVKQIWFFLSTGVLSDFISGMSHLVNGL